MCRGFCFQARRRTSRSGPSDFAALPGMYVWGPTGIERPPRQVRWGPHEAKSFDHSISPRNQSGLDCDAERFGSLQIDHELEYRRSLDRQFSRLLSFQNTVNVVGEPSIGFRKPWSVSKQCTSLRKICPTRDNRHVLSTCKIDNPLSSTRDAGISARHCQLL
jgi:hypothetical protein